MTQLQVPQRFSVGSRRPDSTDSCQIGVDLEVVHVSQAERPPAGLVVLLRPVDNAAAADHRWSLSQFDSTSGRFLPWVSRPPALSIANVIESGVGAEHQR